MDSKTVTGEMAGAITDLMENLNETGELADKISDEEVELNSVYASSLPVDGGTMWVETEDSIYRISPERNQICRVDTYLGEGVILDFTAECWNEIHDAWYYWPLDYWSGTYENGKLNLSHIYAAETDIKATVKSINFNPIINSIKLDLVSDENQIVEIHWESYRGDHYGTIDSREVALIAGWKSPVELYFEGLPYSAPYSYSLSIRIGNAVIDILIRVEE